MSRSRAATPAGKRRKGGTTKAAAKPRKTKTAANPRKTKTAAGSAGRSKASARRPKTKAAVKPRKPKAAPKRRTRPAAPKTRARRSAPKPRRPGAWRGRLAAVAVLAVALAAGYWFWLRDSPLVAVDDVEVVGVTSGDREAIVGELTRVGEGMTTLHVDRDAIERAARAFPTVSAVDIDPNFPHGLRLEVAERPPTLLVESGGRELPVAADGTVLAGATYDAEALPVLALDTAPEEGRLGGAALEQALVVGAAPGPLRPLIEGVDHVEDYGVEITLRGEIEVRFGSGVRAADKWAATATLLADPKLVSLAYVDVRAPERPSVGNPVGVGT